MAVDLKACLSLVVPNQYCPIIIWENWGWFLGDFTSRAMPTSWSSLLWTTIVVHDTNLKFILIVMSELMHCFCVALLAILMSKPFEDVVTVANLNQLLKPIIHKWGSSGLTPDVKYYGFCNKNVCYQGCCKARHTTNYTYRSLEWACKTSIL